MQTLTHTHPNICNTPSQKMFLAFYVTPNIVQEKHICVSSDKTERSGKNAARAVELENSYTCYVIST